MSNRAIRFCRLRVPRNTIARQRKLNWLRSQDSNLQSLRYERNVGPDPLDRNSRLLPPAYIVKLVCAGGLEPPKIREDRRVYSAVPLPLEPYTHGG